MTVDFKYRRIGYPFTQEITSLLRSAQSTVILGPRNVGKRYLFRRVAELLEQFQEQPVLQVQLMSDPALARDQDIRARIEQAVATVFPDSWVPEPRALPLPMLESLDRLQQRLNKAVCLLAANVDGIAHHQARRLLQELQVRVKDGRLVVLLTGEENLFELVHGPNSEFDCATPFVAQGFDRAEFGKYLQNRLSFLRLEIPGLEWATGQLFELTGGNIMLLRAVLGSLVEARIKREAGTGTERTFQVTRGEIENLGCSFFSSGSHSEAHFQRSFEILDREPATWSTIEVLLDKDEVQIAQQHPHLLELAGVCVRQEREGMPSLLRISSPLIQISMRLYYGSRHLGDLYAAHGRWTRAFEHYATLEMDNKIRPTDVDDRQVVLYAVKDLSSALHVEATRGDAGANKLERVRNLFAHGCQQILGFPNVAFWTYERYWKPLGAEQYPDAVVSACTELLAKVDLRQSALKEVQLKWTRCGALCVLPSLREDQREAVIVCDFEQAVPISREREQLLNELMSHLFDAYSHAISVVKARLRLQDRNQHLQIANSIFEALGATVRNPLQALHLAGIALRELGYRRVLFCLVDPVKMEIHGALDLSDDLHFINVAAQTLYPLDDPLADIQPYVVSKREPFIVPDAANEPLVNKKVQTMAGMTSFAVVPMLSADGECVGTIHIEREDRLVPSKEEVEDLEMFGRQLAVALALSERVNLLQVTLDKLQEPVVVVDRRQVVRYANEPAFQLLGFPGGWRDPKELVSFHNEKTKPISPIVSSCLESGQRAFQHVRGLGRRTPGDPAEVLVDSIKDESGMLIGVMVHVADLAFLYRVFGALQLVAGSSDVLSAMRALLEAIQLLGHNWGRLYRIEAETPDFLVSDKGYGFDDPEQLFDQHKIRLPRKRDGFDESWLSLDSCEPVVFQWNDRHPDGRHFTTSKGLPVTVVCQPKCPELYKQKPGDYWLDLPIIATKKAIGKLTVECDENLEPEEFELLKVLSETVGHLLGSMLKAEALQRTKEQWLQEAADKAIAVATHNIGTRLAALDILATRYRGLPDKEGRMAVLNEDLATTVSNCLTAVNRIKEIFTKVTPELSRVPVRQLLCSVLHLRLADTNWSVDCPEDLQAEWDGGLVENAFLEILQNSIDMAKSKEEVRIHIRVSLSDGDKPRWIRVEHEDNGPGVPDELKNRIFEPFFTHRPGKRSGTGLGLHFVKQVVGAHNGKVAEEGRYGQGAKFVVDLPIHYTQAARHEEKELCIES